MDKISVDYIIQMYAADAIGMTRFGPYVIQFWICYVDNKFKTIKIAFVSWNVGKVPNFSASRLRHEIAADFEVSSLVYKKSANLSLPFSISYILLEILISH